MWCRGPAFAPSGLYGIAELQAYDTAIITGMLYSRPLLVSCLGHRTSMQQKGQGGLACPLSADMHSSKRCDIAACIPAAATANQTHNGNGTVALAFTAWLTSPHPDTETGVLTVASNHNANWTASVPVTFGMSGETPITARVCRLP